MASFNHQETILQFFYYKKRENLCSKKINYANLMHIIYVNLLLKFNLCVNYADIT